MNIAAFAVERYCDRIRLEWKIMGSTIPLHAKLCRRAIFLWVALGIPALMYSQTHITESDLQKVFLKHVIMEH